ncbi:MAG: hypothetical protein K1X88_10350 [Nannocystaceae bacterium]|nr:hypothetical protein [Nannocystaceae bacterium]
MAVTVRGSTRARCLAAIVGLAACGREGDPRAWIGERAAVVRCSAAGRNPPPPIMAGIPAPPPPSGLLARQLDPLALDAMGYRRDATVCAVLEAPPGATIDVARTALPAVLTLHDRADREATRIGGRCTCEIARELGVRDLVASCAQTPTVAGCDTAARADELATALQPLREAVAAVELPWQHWRLVGATDRPGWFADHVDALVANHDGGTLVFRPGQALPARVDPAVRALLGLEHVVAVLRQDSGRALVLARELDGLLVLDHFAQPQASPERAPLLERMREAQLTAMVSRLAPPTQARETMAAPQHGTMVELDRPMLEEVDRAALATAVLLDQPAAAPAPAGPPALFDRVSFQAPFGEQGAVLRIEHALSVDGLAWAQTLSDAALVGNLGGLGLRDEPPPPAELPAGLRLVLRGSTTERYAVHGVHRLPSLLQTLELAAPGAVAGTLSAWRVDWPGGPVPAPADAPELFAGLRSLAQRRYRLDASFDPSRTKLVVEITPR